MPTEPVQVLLLSGRPGWARARARGFRRRDAGSADVLDTTGRAVPGLARQVIERTGWAGQAARSRGRPAATETS